MNNLCTQKTKGGLCGIHALFPKVLELAKAGYELSKYAACSKLGNTEEFLSELFQQVQKYQDRYEALKLDEVQP